MTVPLENTPVRGCSLARAFQWLLICAMLSLSLSLPAAEADGVVPGKVLRVIDGDTIDVQLSSGRIRVRLHGVDAPERNQPGGAASTRWLSQQLHDGTVQLEPVSQDQYGRMVAVVHLQGRNINRELVRAGHAFAYRRYLRRSERELCDLEMQAREERAGIWAAAAHAPWEFRSANGKGPFTDHGQSTAADCRKQIGRR